MKLLRKMIAFILVFGLLAGTVAAMPAAVSGAPLDADPPEISASDKTELSSVAATGYVPRLSAPAKTNPYYYSDNNVFYKYGYGMPNCTCYAWGRAYEITGTVPDLCVYSAYLWYDYNIENGIYAYGSEPRPGAIACWVYSSGTAGHVAVVERVEDGVITFSNSAYSGIEFYTSTAPVDDPSDGRETWIFQGYIYLGDYEETYDEDKPSSQAQSGDVYRITSEDGVNLRTSPDTGSGVITVLNYGQDCLVTETKTAGGYHWGCTTYDGTVGWFVIDYASLVYRSDSSPCGEVTHDRTALVGDLDEDGRVSIMDATRIQLIIAGLYTPTKHMLIAGDYDGDNVFSIMDASSIRTYLAFER
jgi:surface antigen